MSDRGSEVKTSRKEKRKREPLGLTCTSTACEQGLHCFLEAPKKGKRQKKVRATATSAASQPSLFELDQATGSHPVPDPNPPERTKTHKCWSCGADLVDWARVYKHDIRDASYTFGCLKIERFRHHYWHIDFDQRALNYALRKGRVALREAAEHRLRKYVGAGVQPDELTFDGRQTGLSRNPIYYAQHATATCCRKCIEVWHDIPKTDDLTEEQIRYLTDLAMLYLDDRLPSLATQGIKVPAIRKPRAATIPTGAIGVPTTLLEFA